jgi:hypothetical protein
LQFLFLFLSPGAKETKMSKAIRQAGRDDDQSHDNAAKGAKMPDAANPSGGGIGQAHDTGKKETKNSEVAIPAVGEDGRPSEVDKKKATMRKATIRCPKLNLSIQLNKLLLKHDPTPDWGRIERICRKTGLNRRCITALVRGTAAEIRIGTLEAIVSYLVNECHLSLREALAGLFGLQPSAFWNMFGSGNDDGFKVRVWQGVRTDKTTSEPKWVNAYDAYLSETFSRNLLAGVTPRQPNLKHSLLRSYSGEELHREVAAEACRCYEKFRKDPVRRALVCIGSMKSMPLSECVMAHTFGVKPFEAGPSNRELAARAVPVFFRYRSDDPQPPSVFGGVQLPLPAAKNQAGIAFESKSGKWEFCPVSENEDVALVFYVCRPATDTIEIVLAGFSGQATGCLAMKLADLTKSFWPPTYNEPHLKAGAYIVRFDFRGSKPDPQSIIGKTFKSKVIALPREVIARRLDPVVPPPDDGEPGSAGCAAHSKKPR